MPRETHDGERTVAHRRSRFQTRSATLVSQALSAGAAGAVRRHNTVPANTTAPAGSLDVSLSRLASVMGAGPGFFYLWWP